MNDIALPILTPFFHYRNKQDRLLPPALKGGVAALGNFDGLHKGHQAILSAAKDLAQSIGGPPLLVSFEPHPRAFFGKLDAPFRITPLGLKAYLASEYGMAAMVILPFDQQMAGMEAMDFINDWLIEALGLSGVAVGEDFCFGKGRAGNADLLAKAGLKVKTIVRQGGRQGGRQWGRQGAYGTNNKDKGQGKGQDYASTTIRQLIGNGEITKANHQLGRPYRLVGKVVKGLGLGQKIGSPTANLDFGDQLPPAHGIYAVRAFDETGSYMADGVVSYGVRPTIGSNLAPCFEVYLFDWQASLYDKILQIDLISYLRAEHAYPDLESLQQQIIADVAAAKSALKDYPLGSDKFQGDML